MNLVDDEVDLRALHALDLDVVRVQKPHFGRAEAALRPRRSCTSASSVGSLWFDQASCSATDRSVVRGFMRERFAPRLRPSIERGC